MMELEWRQVPRVKLMVQLHCITSEPVQIGLASLWFLDFLCYLKFWQVLPIAGYPFGNNTPFSWIQTA